MGFGDVGGEGTFERLQALGRMRAPPGRFAVVLEIGRGELGCADIPERRVRGTPRLPSRGSACLVE